jgi:hypothetical protein
MMERLMSMSGSRDAPFVITWLEYFVTHSDRDTICARKGLDS